MRKTFYLLVAALMASLATQAQNWTLEWNDEFNGTSLNLSDWNYDLGTGSQYEAIQKFVQKQVGEEHPTKIRHPCGRPIGSHKGHCGLLVERFHFVTC